MKSKERREELKKFIESISDGEGTAVIDVNLAGGVELYNPLSSRGKRDLSSEIYDYIDAQTNVIPAEVPLRIRFHGNFSEKEQQEIKQMMHRHYVMRSFDIAWDLLANLRKMLLLTIFGAIVLAVSLYLAITGNHTFLAEILSVVASFSLWETADGFLLERPRLRREDRNNEQNLTEEIVFVSVGK